MNIMQQKPTKDEIISKILADPLFNKADKYKTLLQYLYKCYKEDKIPNEFEIADDVFYKKKGFNPAEDTTVRVYIYRLRKKLEEYYQKHGKNEHSVIQIQKGTYHIEFYKSSEINKNIISKLNRYTYLVTIFVLTLIIIFLSSLYLSDKNISDRDIEFRENKLIWSDFLNNGLHTQYAIGSLFSFYYYMAPFDRFWQIRDDAINNEQDLNAFQEKNGLNKNDISVPEWQIIPKSAALHYGKLLPIFQTNMNNLELKITDELTWDDIENNNIIYVGHIHNLNILNLIFPNQRITIQIKKDALGVKEHLIKVKTSEIDTIYHVVLNHNKTQILETDYVIVSKIPGSSNNTILFICSFSSMGRLKIIDTLTSLKMLENLKKEILRKYDKIPEYFEMVIKVSGFHGTGLEYEIMNFFELPSKFFLVGKQ